MKGKELIFLVLCGCFLNKFIIGATNVLNGLIGEYLFEGNAQDSSGNGNHGTVVGAQLVNDRFGKSNNAYSFNSGKYIYFPGTPFAFPQSMSLSFWINPAALQADWTCIIDKTHSAISGQYTGGYHFLYYKTGYYYYSFVTPSNSLGTQEGAYITFPLNFWTHVAVTKGSNIQYYVNGQLVLSRPFDGSAGQMKTDTLPLVFGACNYGGTNPPSGVSMYFNGKLDDVLIYNRQLSSDEVQVLYQGPQYSVQPSFQPTMALSQSSTMSPTPLPSAVQYSFEPSFQPTMVLSQSLSIPPTVSNFTGQQSGSGLSPSSSSSSSSTASWEIAVIVCATVLGLAVITALFAWKCVFTKAATSSISTEFHVPPNHVVGYQSLQFPPNQVVGYGQYFPSAPPSHDVGYGQSLQYPPSHVLGYGQSFPSTAPTHVVGYGQSFPSASPTIEKKVSELPVGIPVSTQEGNSTNYQVAVVTSVQDFGTALNQNIYFEDPGWHEINHDNP